MTEEEMQKLMSTHHPAAGADIAAAKFRTQRLAEVTAPDRVADQFAVALDVIRGMDEHDSELHDLALVLWHCMRALCSALNGRT